MTRTVQDTSSTLEVMISSPPMAGWRSLTKEQVEEHNRLLSEAELLGLDQNCQVGQHGTFYLRKEPVLSVITWMGVLVSDRVVVHGQTITFKRDGKAYRGRLRKDADCFNFRRVS